MILMITMMMVVETTKKRHTRHMLNDQELLFTVDHHNQPIQPQPRYLVHQHQIWHRTTHVWLYNTDKQILCQQRSLLKDKSPGLWEPFFGGHLAPGVEYIQGALLELGEEIGIKPQASDLHLYKVYKHLVSTEFQGVFLYQWDGEPSTLVLEPDEVEQVKLMALNDVLVAMERQDANWSIAGYAAQILRHIRGLA